MDTGIVFDFFPPILGALWDNADRLSNVDNFHATVICGYKLYIVRTNCVSLSVVVTHNWTVIRNDGRANQFFIQGYHEAIIPRELWLEVQQILKGENVVPVPSVDEVADLSASDVPRILDGFFVIKPRKDGNNEYLRQL